MGLNKACPHNIFAVMDDRTCQTIRGFEKVNPLYTPCET